MTTQQPKCTISLLCLAGGTGTTTYPAATDTTTTTDKEA